MRPPCLLSAKAAAVADVFFCPLMTHLGRRLYTAALRWVVSWISLRSVRGDNNREGNGYGSQASLNILTWLVISVYCRSRSSSSHNNFVWPSSLKHITCEHPAEYQATLPSEGRSSGVRWSHSCFFDPGSDSPSDRSSLHRALVAQNHPLLSPLGPSHQRRRLRYQFLDCLPNPDRKRPRVLPRYQPLRCWRYYCDNIAHLVALLLP